ncbi:putative sulfate exporter family transporter [Nesterenkonia sp. CL21]|uniref:YeiH family protein n=1 Tax=Nesterenkonia sp. CL21 TaxID=3064894 RepID=UPI00287A789B|nr:putative sulfate exporter family transporter [Nesterenkonia sp. CL21]MDS2172621.1 putative sulfate exporter family transporter [Nesterenkonia sp. CL21]
MTSPARRRLRQGLPADRRGLGRVGRPVRRLVPGLAVALMAAVAAHLLAEQIPGVSGLLLAILLGIGLRGLRWIPPTFEAGLRVASRTVLRLAIVLLGLQLVLGDMLALGWEVLVIVAGTVVVTFVGTVLGGRALGTPRGESTMLATGTAICGASAVAAAAAALDRGDGRDSRGRPVDAAAAIAVAVVTLCGTIAMLVLPLLVTMLGLDERSAGIWIGAGVHEVGQVVAAGGMVGATALAVAVVVKLARVVLLAPIMVGLGVVARRRDPGGSAAQREAGRRRTPLIPGFVLGFLGAAVLASVVGIPEGVMDPVRAVTTMLMTMAMVGIGSGVDLPDLLRRGGPALALGVFGTVLALGVSLIGVVVLL